MTETIDTYVVMGNPIDHSKSPEIHSRFAAQTGQTIRYERRLVPLGEFSQALAALIAEGIKGANVTLPFKQDAWRLADERSERAQRAGAVNTLVLAERGRIVGDNTDGVGLVRDLRVNCGFTLAGRRLLLLGAGGAARGILQPLLAAGPAELCIANRTAARATDLAEEFADLGPVSGRGLDAVDAGPWDLIVNATAASLQRAVPAIGASCVGPRTLCYDLAYGPAPTAFVEWALAHGAARALDGLGMLVEQAAEAFLLWRGVRPQTAEVIAALRG